MSENLLQLQRGSKFFGSRKLFNEASFSVNMEEHVGVIGANGAGKSTLFKILIGEEALDEGGIVKSRQLRLGYLSQHDQWSPEETGNEYLQRSSKIPLWELKSKGRLLQLTEDILARPVVSLSGGYRMRIKLLGLIGQEPNLMLLDEPTNYLDLETTLVLERFLQDYEGAFLLISHDREFLKRTTDHILEIEQGEMTKFNGHIDDYFEQKEMLREQLEAKAANQAEKRKAVLEFVARFGASATKARQAQSRLKSLARMQTIEIKPLPVGATVKIPPPTKTGKQILLLEDASFGYDERTILQKASLRIERGDHIAVVGLNGAGKSTLLKGLSGTLLPLEGRRVIAPDVRIAFFAQHVIEALNLADTVESSLESAAHSEVTRQELLNLAGSLLFSGDDIKKKISVLSGGEKSRVALGRVLLQKSACLILDEPTNHLDFQTVEALTNALNSYEGTLIVVSHDRGFIRRVGNKILEVRDGRVLLYPGTYDDYVWSLQRQMDAVDPTENPLAGARAAVEPKKSAESGAQAYEAKKKLEKDLRQIEKKILDCEALMQELQEEVESLNRLISEGGGPSRDLILQLSETGTKLNQAEAQWLELAEQKERILSSTR